MSTGIVAPPRDLHEEWEGADVGLLQEEAKPTQSRSDMPPHSAFALLEDALDLAVEAGLTDWEKRRQIDALITRQFLRANVAKDSSEPNVRQLIDHWEFETSRLGSMHSAKKSGEYQELLQLPSEAVLEAALERLMKGSSPHILMLLADVAGATPAETKTKVDSASQAWIDWGKRQGLI